MPDYNLGRAHGTIRIDYEKSGAKEAREDIKDVGDEAKETAKKVDTSTKESERSYRRLGDEVKRTSVTPDIDEGAFARLLHNITAIQKNTKTSSSILNTFSGRVRLIGGAIAIATPGIAGLGVSLAALSGLAGVAAGALASLGATAATVGVGMSGIGDAFKAASQQAKAAGGSAGASAKAQRAAARAIEDAKRSLADAEDNLRQAQEDAARAAISAAKQVLEAQRDLVSAQRDAMRAQKDLNEARKQATRDLEDMRDALVGGSLDERQAILDVKEAQEELARIKIDPTANADDIARATLNLEKQQFQLEQTRKENQRLAVDQQAAAAAGVEGSDKVVNAQDGVRNAMDSVRQAQESLAEAQENVRRTQIESSRAIADASQAVIDAQRNLADAYADAADSGGAAAAKLDDAMANLSPNARAFVQEVLDLKGAWDGVRRSVQDRLFAGLAEEVKPLANTYFPILQSGLGGIADGLNGMAHSLVDFLKSSEATANVQNIFNNTGTAVGNLKNVARDLVAAFLDIASVGSDFLPDLATGAADAAARFREFISAAKESGSLREWMQGGIDTASTLWQLLKNLGSIIGTVFSAFDQEGGGALNTLTALTGEIDKFLKSAEGQEALHALGRILAAIGSAYGKVFLSFLDAAATILVALEPFIVAFADAAGVYLAAALQALAVVLKPIAELLGALGPALGPVVAGIYAANKAVGAAKVAWGLLNGVMKSNPFVQVAALVVTLALLIIQNWDSITAFLSEAWNTIKETATEIWMAIYNAVVQPIIDAYNAVVQWFTEMKNTIAAVLQAAWTAITSAFTNIKNTISNALSAAVNFVKDGLAKIGTFFRELPGKVIGFLTSLPGKLANWAGDLIGGIIRGLGNLAYKIWQKLKQIVSDAWDAVLDFFGISSPSKLAIKAMEEVGNGMVQGLDNMHGAVSSAADNLATTAASALTGATGSLAANMSVGTSLTGVPNGLVIDGMISAAGALSETTGTRDTAGTVIQIDNLTLQVAGNLDPTNPTAFRQTIIKLKEALRSVEKEYA